MNEEEDAFGEKLSYNDILTAGNITGTAQYNGNISGMKWKTKGPSIAYISKNVNAYAFMYDKLNRLKLANYGSGANGSTWDEQSGAYYEALTYDGMGNIQTLQRTISGGLIDILA